MSSMTYSDIKPTGSVKWNKTDNTFTIRDQTFSIREAIGTADIILFFITGEHWKSSEMLTDEELQNDEAIIRNINQRLENWNGCEVQVVEGKL